MTSTTIERLKQEIEAARSKGDGIAVARLRFEIPLAQRNEWDATRGHMVLTAAGRGYHSPTATVIEASSSFSSTPTNGWPSKLTMYASIHDSLRNLGWDGREEGGWLTGYSSPRTESEREILEVHRASEEDESHRTRTVLRLDRAASLLENLPTDEAVIGDWHCHPPNESTLPSKQDLESWGGLSRQFQRSEWIGLIVSERQDSVGRFAGVDMSAYLVKQQGSQVAHRPLDISTWSF